jgi:hypothetical protein
LSPIDLFWDRCEGPIRYGVNDCCMVVADVVLAAGGPDLMAAYRGRYRTARGFVRAYRKRGYSSVDAAATAMFRKHGEQVHDAADFDVAMVEHFDLSLRRVVTSPAVFIGGLWLFRTDRGGVAVKPDAFLKPPTIYRIS